MKEFKSLLIISVIAILLGCGTEKTKDTSDTNDSVEPTEQTKAIDETAQVSEKDIVKNSMTEYIERTVEGDKSVMYEHEFKYYTEEMSYSEYMTQHRVINYNYDTLRGITYNSVEIVGDTALVSANIIYESVTGDDIIKTYEFKMFKHYGKWIKPYLSRFNLELEYVEQIRIYDSTVAAGKSGN